MKRRTKIKVGAWQFTFCWLQEKHQILAQVRFFKKATEIWRNIPVLLDLNFEVYLKFISIFWEGRKEWLNTPVFFWRYVLKYLASMKSERYFWSPLRRFKHQLEFFAQFLWHLRKLELWYRKSEWCLWSIRWKWPDTYMDKYWKSISPKTNKNGNILLYFILYN